METPKLETVYLAEGKLAGDMIKLLLESFGLEAVVAQESVGLTYGLTVGPIGQVAIMVPEDQQEEARKILAAMDRGELDVDDANQPPESYPNKDPQ